MDFKAGQKISVTIAKTIRRDAAQKTLERLFMKSQAFAAPLEARAANFAPKPKRRGGRIWTKYPNKIHGQLDPGTKVTLTVTSQVLKDLNSVKDLVEVTAV